MNESVLFQDLAPFRADRRKHVCGLAVILPSVLGILGLGRFARRASFDPAAAAAVAVLIFFAALDPRGILISLIFLAVLYLISTRLSWQVSLGASIFGWGFQFLKHTLEGTKREPLDSFAAGFAAVAVPTSKEFSIRVRR